MANRASRRWTRTSSPERRTSRRASAINDSHDSSCPSTEPLNHEVSWSSSHRYSGRPEDEFVATSTQTPFFADPHSYGAVDAVTCDSYMDDQYLSNETSHATEYQDASTSYYISHSPTDGGSETAVGQHPYVSYYGHPGTGYHDHNNTAAGSWTNSQGVDDVDYYYQSPKPIEEEPEQIDTQDSAYISTGMGVHHQLNRGSGDSSSSTEAQQGSVR
ncbi:hypothetical protein JX266_009285 [Neoarthrinium moseri]|nr:hypothetical protein JX266_009285 [Neoarthrinium moseri]